MNLYVEQKRDEQQNGQTKNKEYSSSDEESESDKDLGNNSSDLKSPESIKSPTIFYDKRRSQIHGLISNFTKGITVSKIEVISPGIKQKQIPKIPTVKEEDEYKSMVSNSISSNSASNKEFVSEKSLDADEGQKV